MKTYQSVLEAVGLAVAVSLVCGCLTTTKPERAWCMVMAVQPKAADPFSPAVVKSLQPVLVWTQSTQKGASYDLAIFECSLGLRLEVHNLIYYKEGLTGTEHQVETPLEPNRPYCWSVRVRTPDKVYEWSRYNYNRMMVLPGPAYTSGPMVLSSRSAPRETM